MDRDEEAYGAWAGLKRTQVEDLGKDSIGQPANERPQNAGLAGSAPTRSFFVGGDRLARWAHTLRTRSCASH